MESYAQSYGKELSDTVWNNYVYGDWTQENTSARLASGLDQLELVGQAGFTARTTSNGVGGRLIQLVNSGNSYNSAIALGHESYRDGIIGTAEQQGSETLAATTAHTQMALRMLDDGKAVQMTENLDMDITAYKLSQHLGDESIFAGYVAGNYDASADYWKLMKNGDLVDDDDGWLRDENGNFILDNDGNKIGDSGKETGLLNILFGKMNDDGTVSYSGREYDSFSDEEIKVAQALMLSAGMKNDGAENFRDVRWISEENGDHVISAKEILSEAGNTVATPVFMNALDKASDTVVFEPSLSTNVISSMDYSYRNRFLDFVQVKEDFYFENRLLLDNDPWLVWTQNFAKSDVRDNDGNIIYKDGYHKGIDVAGKMNSPIYAYYSGKVVDKKFNTSSSGYSVVINYGFQFENSFYSTGVSAQFMHFSEESLLSVGDYVSSTSLVGGMGNTGTTSGATGVHLHYQLMGDLGGTAANSPKWNMYVDRRNRFLDAFGSTGSMYAGGDYMNYYYDINNLKERLAIR